MTFSEQYVEIIVIKMNGKKKKECTVGAKLECHFVVCWIFLKDSPGA